MRVGGIILIVVGVLMLIFQGFSYTQEKKVVDIGPIEVNKKEKKTIGWPIYAGVIALVAGGVMVFAGSKEK